MPTVKLTDAAVQRFKVPKGQRKEWFDASLPGFGIRVAGPTASTPEGRKSWIVFYRYCGEQKRLTLGRYVDGAHAPEGQADLASYGVALSLADARKLAGDAIALASKGLDPATHRAVAKAEAVRTRDTIGSTVEKFLASGMKGRKGKPLAGRYLEETQRNFDRHVLPRWNERELASITRRDVIELLDAIAANEVPPGFKAKTKQKRPMGGAIAANRVLAACRAMFNWALRRGMIDTNPCSLVERPGEEVRRERTLTPAELQELWVAFSEAGQPFGSFFKLTLLTGQRRSEVAKMRWVDLDLEAATWSLPSDATKNGLPHVVPLSPQALAIIKAMPRKTMTLPDRSTTPSPYVFTTSGAAPISGFSQAKAAIDTKVQKARTEAKITETMPAWGIHDLRRTAATEMGRLGTSEFVIGKVLNHASRSVTGQVYNRYEYLTEKRHALETWGDYVTRLMQLRVVSGGAVDEVAA